jgi:hypothetical protein
VSDWTVSDRPYMGKLSFNSSVYSDIDRIFFSDGVANEAWNFGLVYRRQAFE